jgi:hypothetical protein
MGEGGELYVEKQRLGVNERTGVEREIYTVNRVRDGRGEEVWSCGRAPSSSTLRWFLFPIMRVLFVPLFSPA